MSTRRDRDLRHHHSSKHAEGADHDVLSAMKKDKSRGIFSRMFGSSSQTESAAEANYRKKMTDATEEQQQQHPYYHSNSSTGSSRERERDRDRTRERESRDKDSKERDREHRTERDRDRERERDRDRDHHSVGTSSRSSKESSKRDRDRDRERDRGDGSSSRDSRERERKDRDRAREQHSQSFSHSSQTSERRFVTSTSNIYPDPTPKKSSSRTHTTSSSVLSPPGKPPISGSEESKSKSGSPHENAYLSSLLSTSSSGKSHRPAGSLPHESGSGAAVTKAGTGGGVSAGGSLSRLHDSGDYDFGASPSMMHMTPGSGITPSHQTLFLDMNRMFDVTGIKFDRSGVTAGEAIAVLGDQHLARLEEMCKKILVCILSDKERALQGQSKDPDSLSNGNGHTEVALIYTEVLQLQGRPQEAVVVLSKAIEELNSDLAEAKKHRSRKHSASDSPSAISHSVEFEHLKKMKALCHRRIGSLYKLTNRLKDAEEHIKRYISIVERTESTDDAKREISLAYSLLTTMYEAMGKTAEAQAADKVSIELAASMGRVD